MNRTKYQSQKFHFSERPIEYAFVFKCLIDLWPRKLLDVGPGNTAWPSLMSSCGFEVVALDKKGSYWRDCFFNQHFYVLSDDITAPSIDEEFDFITCISTLEHISDHRSAMNSMFRLLKPGGHVVLTFPYCAGKYVDNVYELPQSGYGQDFPYICQVFSYKEIAAWLGDNSWSIVRQEFYEVFTGELWTFGEWLHPPRKAEAHTKHHLTAILMRKSSTSKSFDSSKGTQL